MPAGLQIMGTRGELILDITNRITRTTGPLNYTTVANQAGSVTIPDVGSGSPFFIVLTTPRFPYNTTSTILLPTFTRVGNDVYWTAAPGVVDFIVGAY